VRYSAVLDRSTNVSKEHIASIFRVEEQAVQESSVIADVKRRSTYCTALYPRRPYSAVPANIAWRGSEGSEFKTMTRYVTRCYDREMCEVAPASNPVKTAEHLWVAVLTGPTMAGQCVGAWCYGRFESRLGASVFRVLQS
jgi:hypothetical protein